MAYGYLPPIQSGDNPPASPDYRDMEEAAFLDLLIPEDAPHDPLAERQAMLAHSRSAFLASLPHDPIAALDDAMSLDAPYPDGLLERLQAIRYTLSQWRDAEAADPKGWHRTG